MVPVQFISSSPPLQHLLTVSLGGGEVADVEAVRTRLSQLAQADQLWSQCMVLEVGPAALRLLDITTKVCLLEDPRGLRRTPRVWEDPRVSGDSIQTC